MAETLLELDLPGIPKLKSGKVREIFDLGDRLLFVATDRISAFDVIMPKAFRAKARWRQSEGPDVLQTERTGASRWAPLRNSPSANKLRRTSLRFRVAWR